MLGAKVESRMTVVLPSYRACDQHGRSLFGGLGNALIQLGELSSVGRAHDAIPLTGLSQTSP